MSEPTTGITLSELEERVAFHMGFDTVTANRTAAQETAIDNWIRSGLRRFYAAFEWTFLKPYFEVIVWGDVAVDATVTVTGEAVGADGLSTLTASAASFHATMVGHSIVITGVGTFKIRSYTSTTSIEVVGDTAAAVAATFSIAADGDYRLPDFFGGMEGGFQIIDGSNRIRVPITSPKRVFEQRHSTITPFTGPPQLAAYVVAPEVSGQGPRYNLMLYPIPEAEYTLSGRCFYLRDVPGALTDHPAGGATHAETILKACLAAADLYGRNLVGEMESEYVKALADSMRRDLELFHSDTLGYNSDKPRMARNAHGDVGLFTYNNTVYGDI